MNLRPAKALPQLLDARAQKRKVVEGVDIMVVRDLTGDVYFGEPKGIKVLDGDCVNGGSALFAWGIAGGRSRLPRSLQPAAYWMRSVPGPVTHAVWRHVEPAVGGLRSVLLCHPLLRALWTCVPGGLRAGGPGTRGRPPGARRRWPRGGRPRSSPASVAVGRGLKGGGGPCARRKESPARPVHGGHGRGQGLRLGGTTVLRDLLQRWEPLAPSQGLPGERAGLVAWLHYIFEHFSSDDESPWHPTQVSRGRRQGLCLGCFTCLNIFHPTM